MRQIDKINLIETHEYPTKSYSHYHWRDLGHRAGSSQTIGRQRLETRHAGRREEKLRHFQAQHPGQVEIQPLDVTQEDAPQQMRTLIGRTGGMDVFLLAAGIGSQNPDLRTDTELNTAATNIDGFIRMITTAFDYFKQHDGGHIAVISSIAGTKGLGIAPAYSATKRFQNTYIEALTQLAHMQKLAIRFK